MNLSLAKQQLEENGFSILGSIYTKNEIDNISSVIENNSGYSINTNDTKKLFSIRKLLITFPQWKTT